MIHFQHYKCGESDASDAFAEFTERTMFVTCPSCIGIMMKNEANSKSVVHFTKAPLFGFTEAEAAAMCLCAGWNYRDTYIRVESSVTCPQCLKLMDAQKPDAHVCRPPVASKPYQFWGCPECGKPFIWSKVATQQPRFTKFEYHWVSLIPNPAYETASHEVEFKAHPDVWRKVRPVSGTYTVKPQT